MAPPKGDNPTTGTTVSTLPAGVIWYITLFLLIKGIFQNEKMDISDKAFEPLFFDFADRADFRWLFTGTEIPADRTTPDR